MDHHRCLRAHSGMAGTRQGTGQARTLAFRHHKSGQQTVVRLLAAALSLSDLFYRTILFLCSVQGNELLQVVVSLFCLLLVLCKQDLCLLRVGSYK